MLGPPAGDCVGDSACAQPPPVLVVVITTVGDDSLGTVAWPADRAPNMRNRIQERDQLGDIVAVGRRRRPGKQEPVGVGQDVVLGTRPAAVDRARPEPGAPFLACTYEASTIARDQSI